MTGSPISCQVVQKLLSYLDPAMRDQLATTISKQFSDLALHPFGHQPVLALLAVGSQDQRDMLPYQLEREDILLVDLLLDKKGSFLPQASEDSFKHCYQFGVRSCGGWVSSTIFHSFSRSSSGCSLGRTGWTLDILEEKVMDNLEMMVFKQVGHWVVQTVVKLGHPSHIIMATTWIEKNMKEVMMDSTAVFVASSC